MRKLILLVLIVIKYNCSSAQNIIGIWQLNTPEITSGYFNTYQFFKTGEFRFNTNQSDGLRRILSIGGKYKAEKNKLTFHVEYTIEMVDGSIKRDEITPGSDSWSIIDGQIKKIRLPKSITQFAILTTGKKDKEVDMIEIDKAKYYKVDNDPNNFQ